jgi:hypothetical protein
MRPIMANQPCFTIGDFATSSCTYQPRLSAYNRPRKPRINAKFSFLREARPVSRKSPSLPSFPKDDIPPYEPGISDVQRSLPNFQHQPHTRSLRSTYLSKSSSNATPTFPLPLQKQYRDIISPPNLPEIQNPIRIQNSKIWLETADLHVRILI